MYAVVKKKRRERLIQGRMTTTGGSTQVRSMLGSPRGWRLCETHA